MKIRNGQQKAVALFESGNPFPIMYFQSTFTLAGNNLGNIPKLNSYSIDKGTVWLQARLFINTLPADSYVGFIIEGGKLDISGLFVTSQMGVHINPLSNYNFSFTIAKPALPAFGDKKYGADARAISLTTPSSLTCSNGRGGFKILGEKGVTVFGNTIHCPVSESPICQYFPQQNRLGIKLKPVEDSINIPASQSVLCQISGQAKIENVWWGLSLTTIPLMLPLEAKGNDAIMLQCGAGLYANLLQSDSVPIALNKPFISVEPDRLNVTDEVSNGTGKAQTFNLWNSDKTGHENKAVVYYLNKAAFIYNSLAVGDEVLNIRVGSEIHADRPVNIKGEPLFVKSNNGLLTIEATAQAPQIGFSLTFDRLFESPSLGAVAPVKSTEKTAFALSNALLTTTLPLALTLKAALNDDFKTLSAGRLTLSYGLYDYLPILPDPYVANLNLLQNQFEREVGNIRLNNSANIISKVWMWVEATVRWNTAVDNTQAIDTTFNFIDFESHKLTAQANYFNFQTQSFDKIQALRTSLNKSASILDIRSVLPPVNRDIPNYASFPNPNLTDFDFTLLDISSNANLTGVSFSSQTVTDREQNIGGNSNTFPLHIEDNMVGTDAAHTRLFMLPGIAWEPLLNISDPQPGAVLDPLRGFNYFPNDGIPTMIGNFSKRFVPLAPLPLGKHLVNTFKKEDGKLYALFNLPFGMVAFAILDKNKATQKIKPTLQNISPEFDKAIVGGVQLELTAGSSFDNDNGQGLFEGITIQLVNLKDSSGNNKSTLGETPTDIFNKEFQKNVSGLKNRTGVPVTKVGLSGYGTSMVSKWANDEAIFAQVSKAEFNVYTGRTSHELVQVVSKEYPFGAKLVRTITIFRMSNGYVLRVDSGWKAQTPGLYDFSYLDDATRAQIPSPFAMHPGVVKGVYNIRNIKEAADTYTNSGAEFKAITYDADILLENVVEGGNNNLVPSTGVVGYIQLKPQGQPVSSLAFTNLLKDRGNNKSIGGAINCVVKIAGTNQHIKLNRFDVSPSVNSGGTAIYVASARGSVFLPKEGSWSMVQHKIGDGKVIPLPDQMSVPLIKEGLRLADYNPLKVLDGLHRIADPANLFVTDPTSVNYGFLQNMGSQKVLYLTPSFKKGVDKLLSKTPPLFADSFRLLKSDSIFPNIGDATTNFGQAISLLKGGAEGAGSVEAFAKAGIQELGKDVYEILNLNIKKEGEKFLDQGYQLAKSSVNGVIDKALKFDLPNTEFELVNLKNILKIKIKYASSSKANADKKVKDYVGKFDFDVDSLANDAVDNWKGKMNNLSLVVSVGALTDLMTVKGNFNAQKGKELDLGSKSNTENGDFNLPTPEIQFSDAVEPVIRILEILASLSTGDYGAALKKGLKIAMSNSGELWQYKFEASKEIPLVRFPPGPLYDSPQTPLKLECSLQVGFNVNAALKVTTDPTQLLPTAGAFFAFRGRLTVMCFSVGVGTIFAIGEAGIKLIADTSPNLQVILHFGFGAQIGVGLPVVGTATVTFMVGVEIAAGTNGAIAITAFMLFKGQAELLGGLVGICIMIEARGTVNKLGPGKPANCEVQVTFAIDVSIFLVINIHFQESWTESRQIA